MKKKFTLIELIVVIAIISILAVIVIPNVSSMNSKAYTSKVTGNIKNIQTAVDMYALDNNGQYPVAIQPTLEEPQIINFDLLYPKYLKSIKKIENENYWVDYSGRVWGSTVDAPTDVYISPESIEWGNEDEIKEYNVYEVVDKSNQGAMFNKKISLRNKVLTHKTIDKFKMDNENKDFLVSAVDHYGLETAPVGPNYFGVESDWFSPIIKKEGTFESVINAEELMYWDAFKTIEDKPEGTSIKYEFAVTDEGGNYGTFTEDFYSLLPSKSLKIKITMKGFNNSMPSIYDMRIFYHFAYDENYRKPTRVSETTEKVVDEYVLEDMETIDQIIVTDSYIIGNKPKTTYEYSTDGSSYIPIKSLIDVPSGSRIRIIREGTGVDFNVPIVKVYTKPIIVQDAEVPFVPIVDEQILVPKDAEVQDNNWTTIQEFALVGSSGDGQLAHWISIDIDDVQPENTRILYRYATSNGFGWSNFTNDFSKLSDSRMVKVYAILQVAKDYVGKVENPYINNIVINSSKGVINLDAVKPTGLIKPIKDNNGQREDISTSSQIKWEYEVYDPQGKEIVEVVWGGDKRNNYDTPGFYTVTLKLRNELNYWSDEIKFTFEVKSEKPVAVINPDKDTFSSKIPLSLDTTASYDPDGDKIVKAEWGGDYKEDGIYPMGEHNIRLRVQDEEGNLSDWLDKTFNTVDTIFFGIPYTGLDKDSSTSTNFRNATITWDGDLTNKVVHIDGKTESYSGSIDMFIKDANGNNLNFRDTNGTLMNKKSFPLATRITFAIVMPEGATQIVFVNDYYADVSIYDIYEAEDIVSTEPVTNVQAVPEANTVLLTWENPQDSDFEKVYILRGNQIVGTSTTGTFKDVGLYGNTEYTYELIALDQTGNYSTSQYVTTRTLKRDIYWYGIDGKAFDKDASTTISIRTATITWDGDLSNKVVHMDFMNTSYSGGHNMYIKNESNQNLSFYDTNGVLMTKKSVPMRKRQTFSIVMPEGATKIVITNEASSSMRIYDIHEADDIISPSSVTNISAISSKTSVNLTWTNPTDIDFSKVAIYNESKSLLGYSSVNSFQITSLTPSTTYTFYLETIDTTGNRSKKVEYQVTTEQSISDKYSKIDLSGGSGGIGGEYTYTALNGTIVTSSAPVYGTNSYYHMPYLFDGKYGTANAHTNYWLTSSSGNQTLTFDFLNERNIKGIRVMPRTRSDASSNFRLLASNDNTNWTPLTDWHTTTTSQPYDTTVEDEFNSNYRYYRFELTRNGSFGVTLAEIEFYE